MESNPISAIARLRQEKRFGIRHAISELRSFPGVIRKDAATSRIVVFSQFCTASRKKRLTLTKSRRLGSIMIGVGLTDNFSRV